MAINGLSPELKQYFSSMNPALRTGGMDDTADIQAGMAPTSATRKADVNKTTPTSSLDEDPLGYRYISYPKDVTQDMANGHYMLFYVNVQNKSGYEYHDPDGARVGGVVERKKLRIDTEYGGMMHINMSNTKVMMLNIKEHLIELQAAEKVTFLKKMRFS